jgi:hypothetical protein
MGDNEMRLVFFSSIQGVDYYVNPESVKAVWANEGDDHMSTIIFGDSSDDYIQVDMELADVANLLEGR